MFYTYKKLQGSQTFPYVHKTWLSFYTYKKLQGSQTLGGLASGNVGFTLIRNYKVLKHRTKYSLLLYSFTLIRNYKVLKQ